MPTQWFYNTFNFEQTLSRQMYMGNIKIFLWTLLEAYSEPSRMSKMEFFAKIINGFQLLEEVKRIRRSKLAVKK